MKARVAPKTLPPAPDGYDWRGVFRAVARNAFLCGDQRRNGPVTLAWVVTHADEVLEHATEEPPPPMKRVVVAAPDDTPPPPMPEATHPAVAALFAQVLPEQTCTRCETTFRHAHPGECWECHKARYVIDRRTA